MPLSTPDDARARGVEGWKVTPTAHGAYPVYRPPRYFATSLPHYDQHSYREVRDVHGNTVFIPAGRNFTVPLASISARLIFMSRKGMMPMDLPEGLPLNRQHAFQVGRISDLNQDVDRTRDAVEAVNASKGATPTPVSFRKPRFADDEDEPLSSDGWGSGTSQQWDEDRLRWEFCGNAWARRPFAGGVYMLGGLSGAWEGRRIVSLRHLVFET